MVFGQNLKILTSAKKDTIGKGTSRGAEWRKFQLHSTFHCGVMSADCSSLSLQRAPPASGTETAVSSDTSGGEEGEEGEGEEAGEGGSGEASVRPASAASRDETQVSMAAVYTLYVHTCT